MLVDERRQDIQEVFVGDGETVVQLVQASQGPPAPLTVVAPLNQLADDDIRVVIPFLGTPLKLAGAIQQGRNTRDAKGPEQRELESAGGVERKLAFSPDPTAPATGLAYPHGPILILFTGTRRTGPRRPESNNGVSFHDRLHVSDLVMFVRQ